MNKKKTSKAFTLVELLTVISVIAVLMVLIVPVVNQVARVGQQVKQTSQLSTISVALETFNNDFGQYPNSSNKDTDNADYYGCQKLAEALMGQDMLGLNSAALPNFYATGNDGTDDLYDSTSYSDRYGPYIEPDRINPVKAASTGDVVSLSGNGYYISDVYRRDGNKLGIPVLYYKADTSYKTQDSGFAAGASVYNYNDNNFNWSDSGTYATFETQE